MDLQIAVATSKDDVVDSLGRLTCSVMLFSHATKLGRRCPVAALRTRAVMTIRGPSFLILLTAESISVTDGVQPVRDSRAASFWANDCDVRAGVRSVNYLDWLPHRIESIRNRILFSHMTTSAGNFDDPESHSRSCKSVCSYSRPGGRHACRNPSV